VYRKLRKLHRDPIGYCLDSKHSMLSRLGRWLYTKQTRRFENVGAANAHCKVTVIMTAYNTGHLVEGAVKSVLAQSHQNFELMIIDDASTDNTLDVLKSLAETDARIRVLHSPRNHGTYWSKNWCLQQASSEFVAFHDSDDISDPMRLQMQLGAMISKKLAATACRWQRVDTEGNILTIDGLSERMAAISLMIRRKEVVDTIGYFDNVRISADTEFIRRINKVFGVQRLFPMRQVLYTGLLRDDSLTRSTDGGFTWQEKGHSYTRELSGDRQVYHATFVEWQDKQLKEGLPLVIGFPSCVRKFPAPDYICQTCDDMNIEQVQDVTCINAA